MRTLIYESKEGNGKGETRREGRGDLLLALRKEECSGLEDELAEVCARQRGSLEEEERKVEFGYGGGYI